MSDAQVVQAAPPWYSKVLCQLRKHRLRWAVCRVVVFFLLALIALDFLVAAHSRLWRDYDPDPYRERLEACRRQPWDLVVVGGSPVMYGMNPSVLSGVAYQGRALDRVYNLGLPLATASEIDLAVEHDLPGAPPRLLVYGVSATDYNEDRVEPHGPRQLMTTGDVARWSWNRPEATLWAVRQFAQQRVESLWKLSFYRYGIRLWAADEAERFYPGVCPEAAATARTALTSSAAVRSNNGFQTVPASPENRLDCLKAASKIEPTFSFMEHYRIDGYLRNLHRLMDQAARRRIPLLLVDMPVSADLDQRMYPREYAAYHAALTAAAQAHGVRILYATREAVGLTDADFADVVHLNAAGADRLSAWLRRQLEQM
jgi:hypothetical protein